MSRRQFLQNHFRQSFESSPESRGSQTSGVLLVLFVQAKSTKNRSLLLGAPRFCKPRISAPQPQICTATIKTFFRKIRGFANLESAHKTTTSHKPNYILFSALRRCPFRAARPACKRLPFGSTRLSQTSIPSAAAAASHK